MNIIGGFTFFSSISQVWLWFFFMSLVVIFNYREGGLLLIKTLGSRQVQEVGLCANICSMCTVLTEAKKLNKYSSIRFSMWHFSKFFELVRLILGIPCQLVILVCIVSPTWWKYIGTRFIWLCIMLVISFGQLFNYMD